MTDLRKEADEHQAAKVRAKGLRWQLAPVHLALVERADRRSLLVTIGWNDDEQHYNVVAQEMGHMKDAQSVFNDHSHAAIGMPDNELEAKSLARDYAAAWLEGKTTAESCDCPPIDGRALLGPGGDPTHPAHDID